MVQEITLKKSLSVVIPMYNEESFILDLLRSLEFALTNLSIEFELIVVDDKSLDTSVAKVLESGVGNLRLIQLNKNEGKGNAVRTGIMNSNCDLILIQDADQEYFPSDIGDLLLASNIKSGVCVYGSRFLGAAKYQKGLLKLLRIWPKQKVGPWGFNIMLTLIFMVFRKKRITDLMTGYKLYPSELFENWLPATNGFETDHEITLRILETGLTITEVPIHYRPRSKAEGKKIRMSDGVKAIKVLLT